MALRSADILHIPLGHTIRDSARDYDPGCSQLQTSPWNCTLETCDTHLWSVVVLCIAEHNFYFFAKEVSGAIKSMSCRNGLKSNREVFSSASGFQEVRWGIITNHKLTQE